jgi:hypothetical protein
MAGAPRLGIIQSAEREFMADTSFGTILDRLMEPNMNTQASTYSLLNIVALGWGFSAALVVLFVICLAVALVFPDWRASHGWIGLFSVAPMTSVRVWIDGIVFSVVFGWVAGIVLGLVYNHLIRR